MPNLLMTPISFDYPFGKSISTLGWTKEITFKVWSPEVFENMIWDQKAFTIEVSLS